MMLCCAPTTTTARQPDIGKAATCFSPCRCSPHEFEKPSDKSRMRAELSKKVQSNPTMLEWQQTESRSGVGVSGVSPASPASWASLPINVEPLMSDTYSNDEEEREGPEDDDGTVQTVDTTLSSSTQGSCRSSSGERGRGVRGQKFFAPLVRPVPMECSDEDAPSISTSSAKRQNQNIFRRLSSSPSVQEGGEEQGEDSPWTDDEAWISRSLASDEHDDTDDQSSMLTLKRANPIYDSEEDEDDYRCNDDDLVNDAVGKRSRLHSYEAPTWARFSSSDAPTWGRRSSDAADKEQQLSSMISIKRANPIHDIEEEDEEDDEASPAWAAPWADSPLRTHTTPRWKMESLLEVDSCDSKTTTSNTTRNTIGVKFSAENWEMLRNYKVLKKAEKVNRHRGAMHYWAARQDAQDPWTRAAATLSSRGTARLSHVQEIHATA